MNALRGRWENFFSSEQVCVVRLETPSDIIHKLVYVATNPIKAGLVVRVDEWPGATGYRALMTGHPMRATRPRHFFSNEGTMPDEVTLHCAIPPELADREQVLAHVRAGVTAVEEREARKRAASGRSVLGRYANPVLMAA